mmetsp:Transcript_7870/g.22260  ORF Transcript_7870/g.22260 Transcript_7870/m.22260 type:complete len:1284 (+) Transcript_7870:145-3996(+)
MGIPRFYRWLSERYPLINEMITEEQIPEFDNLYLDMNGIIHTCSHNNTGGLCVKDESDVFVEAFNYIVRLFRIIRPRKLLYMAVDGCAPRAKMNQQRSRRFRAANDAREAREKALEMGEEIDGTPFDSNCITPGTEFMGKLTEHLRFFVCKKIQEDPLWQGLDVVVSGPDVPGEGEHKIMDYIRCAKAQPDYDPNLRHCLYGLDADLIMLALASHEPHFALLREEVVFGKQAAKRLEQRMLASKKRFQLLHISLVREYLNLEFKPAAQLPRQFEYNLERLIDDFVLFCVMVGNDFLPCLPFAEIGEGGLDFFFASYKEHLQNASGSQPPWLICNCGEVRFDQFAKFLKRYAETEHKQLETAVEDNAWVLGKRHTVGPQDAPEPPNFVCGDQLEMPPNAELARVHYYDIKFGMDINTHEGTQAQRTLFQSYIEGLQWVLHYYFRGPDNASWSWYYPFYHAPMAADLAMYDRLAEPKVHFKVDAPFHPFQQLMGVLPANSKALLPQCYQWLFDSPESPIAHFYPLKFQIDIDGVKVPWGGVTLIPFIDPEALLQAMAEAERRGPKLTEAEKRRNEVGRACCFRHDLKEDADVPSIMPHRFKSLSGCAVRWCDFSHAAMPAGVDHFDSKVPPGCVMPAPGFPSLALHPLTTSMETGVKVFQFEARGESIIVHLHPDGPIVPREEKIMKLLKAPYVLIDYPMEHRGQVVAVHTAHTLYLAGGRKRQNSVSDHNNFVWRLIEEWRKKGLAVDFDGETEEQRLQHPIAEVRPIESSYLDAQGQTQYRPKSTGDHCSLHLLREAGEAPAPGPEAASDGLGAGTPVLCTASGSAAFGQMGIVEESGGGNGSLKACFRLGLTLEEQEALELEIQRIVMEQHQSLRWWSLVDLAKEVRLDAYVLKQILGSLMARGADNVREDIGMSLMCETWDGNVATSLCLPAYSARWDGAWFFSDLAVTALKDYIQRFPRLFSALKDRRPHGRDFDLRLVFPDCPDQEYAIRQLVKYCSACPFKQLCLATEDHMALAAPAIAEVVRVVDIAKAKLETQPLRMERVTGSENVYQVGNKRRWLSSRLPSSADVKIGQRGVCIDSLGPVPCGMKGTVLGIYGSGEAQLLELLLDEETFGATDLNGRTPRLRGVQVSLQGFMLLSSPPREAAADATPVRDAEAPVRNHADTRRLQPRGRWAKGNAGPLDGEESAMSRYTAGGKAASPAATPSQDQTMPHALPAPSRLASVGEAKCGTAENGGRLASGGADAEDWAKAAFEELISLAPRQRRSRGVNKCGAGRTAK